jgi:hypothetical protein
VEVASPNVVERTAVSLASERVILEPFPGKAVTQQPTTRTGRADVRSMPRPGIELAPERHQCRLPRTLESPGRETADTSGTG